MLSQSDYSFLDRALHRLALARPGLQVGMAEVETDLFRKALARVPIGGEVFVTGLPRSGTTILLNLLYSTGEFASFTYRHMPFILAPLLWDRLSRPFRRRAVNRERAHGDGMNVSFDSPEAFEEVLWLAHLRDAYVRADRLIPLEPSAANAEFKTAFRDAIRKCRLLAAGDGDPAAAPRYLSKNNANVSRLALLAELCPDCRILVPFRHPLSHVSSLMRQHALFHTRHDTDVFGQQYMAWLGHFEFGHNLRPIDFDGWLAGGLQPETGHCPKRMSRSPDAAPLNYGSLSAAGEQGFWIRYWTAAYTYALAHAGERVRFVDFDALLTTGRASLAVIADHVGLGNPEALIAGAARLRAPTTRPLDVDACSSADLKAAIAVHQRLQAASADR